MITTPEAQQAIDYIEGEVTRWYAGGDVDFTDLIDRALSLSGLMITVASSDNVACIQER